MPVHSDTSRNNAVHEAQAARPETFELYWEDFQPGCRFECGTRRISKREILEFAELYDPQRFHLDEAFCAETIYGGLIASGAHVWATCMGLVARSLFNRSANMGSPGLDYLRWHCPMRPDDVVSAAVEVESTEPSSRAAFGKLKLRFELRNHLNEKMMTAVANVMMGRRSNPTQQES